MASYQEKLARYQELRRQGYSGPQAAEMAFGPGGLQAMQQEQAKESGRARQAGQLGQVGGTVAGAYVGKEAYRALFPAKEAADVAKPVADATSGAGAVSGTAGGTAGSGAPLGGALQQAMTVPQGNVVPQGGAIPSGYEAVGSAPNGGTIVAPKGAVQSLPPTAQTDAGFLAGVDWAKVGQGAAGAAQLYSAYKAAQNKDYAGAGIYGTAGAANLAAATGAMSTGTGTLGATVVPGANLLAGGYGAYQTAEMTGNMAAGKQRDIAASVGGLSAGAGLGGAAAGAIYGSAAGPVGMAIGAAIGLAAGYLGSKFGSSKNKAQATRDAIRKGLKENKILDDNYMGTLADGSTYDFGKDGSTLKWKEIDKIAAANPEAWKEAVELSDALVAGYNFVGQNNSNISIMYAKGAISNANNDPAVAAANMKHFARQQGFTYDQIKEKLDAAKGENRINDSQYNYYLGGARKLFDGAPAGAPGAPTAPGTTAAKTARAAKGEVARQSAGLYRDDKGKLVRGQSMRQALERAYKQPGKKETKRKEA